MKEAACTFHPPQCAQVHTCDPRESLGQVGKETIEKEKQEVEPVSPPLLSSALIVRPAEVKAFDILTFQTRPVTPSPPNIHPRDIQ